MGDAGSSGLLPSPPPQHGALQSLHVGEGEGGEGVGDGRSAREEVGREGVGRN